MSRLRIEIFPDDLDRTVQFYRDVLGFHLIRDERARPSEYVALQLHDVRIGAARRPPCDSSHRRPPVGVELVLEVDDLAGMRERVRDQGWPVAEDVTDRPWGLSDFRLLDPDGYYWRVTEIEGAGGRSDPGRPAEPSIT